MMSDNNPGGAASTSEELSVNKEQERLLPIANVGRIMKQILPPNAKVSKEAKETMQECVSEFISFVTSEASEEKCRKERRKTLNGDDLCWAISSLGFDDYAAPLRRYLHRYRELEGDRPPPNTTTTHPGGGGAFDDEHDIDNLGGGGSGGAGAANSFKFDGI